MTIKNKTGQTAIDITNSKVIISVFWKYLTKNSPSNSSEDNNDVEMPKVNIVQKFGAKVNMPHTKISYKPKDAIITEIHSVNVINH